MPRCKLLPAALALAACDAAPTAPAADAGRSTELNAPTAALLASSPLLILNADPQLVMLERGSGETERGWFQAHIVFRDLGARDGAVQMDGAILVVAAADGPMPKAPSGREEWLHIRVERGRLEADNAFSFEGTATLRDGIGGRVQFPIAGSGRPMASNPDCLVFDILGSNLYDDATFEADVKLVVPGP